MITTAELSKMSVSELRDLNRKVVDMLKLKIQIDGKINSEKLSVGMTVKYIVDSKKISSNEEFRIEKINKVNAICKSKTSGKLWNIKLANIKQSN